MTRQVLRQPPHGASYARPGLWGCLNAVFDKVEWVLGPRQQLQMPRQEFLCSSKVACVLLLLISSVTAIGTDLYLTGAALPWIAAWVALPTFVVIVLMGRGLRAHLRLLAYLTEPEADEPPFRPPLADDAKPCQEFVYALRAPRPPPR